MRAHDKKRLLVHGGKFQVRESFRQEREDLGPYLMVSRDKSSPNPVGPYGLNSYGNLSTPTGG